MILRSLTVEGWRCLVGPVTVGPFDEGINVLHAPNASGKSTLFEALIRGLLDSHRVTGRDIEAVRPWGRSLSPRVSVEFAHDGSEYRLVKRFLERASSELYRLEEGKFVRLAEADAADERVRAILSSNPPGRGLSRPSNWGLAQILWAPQGHLALPRLSGDLVSDIRECLGSQVAGSRSGPLEQKIEQLFLQVYTPGGKLKTGKDAPAVVKARRELEKARGSLQVAIERFRSFENAMRRVEDLRLRQVQLKREAEALENRVHEARQKADSYRSLISLRDQHREQVRAAEARYGELKQRMENIRSVRGEIRATQEKLDVLKEEYPLRERELDTRRKEVAAAKTVLEDVRKDFSRVRQAHLEAENARRYLQAKQRFHDLDRRIGFIARAEEELRERRAERNRMAAPDSRTLGAIQKALKDRDAAHVRLEAALITLEIVPEKQGRIEVVAGEKTGPEDLVPGRPVIFRGSPEVTVDLLGTARIRARGPSGSVDELRRAHSEAVDRIEELTRAFGTADYDRLQMLAEKAKELDARVNETKARLEALLAGDDPEAAAREHAAARNAVEGILAGHESWKDNDPDVNGLERTAARIERIYTEELSKAEATWETAQIALLTSEKKRDEVQAAIASCERMMETLHSRLATLVSDDKTDDERRDELRRIEMSWGAARSSLEETEARIGSFEGGDPAKTAAILEKQLQGALKDAQDAMAEEKLAEGRLGELSGQGPYSALARCEEEVAVLEVELAREERRADAIRLLHMTTEECGARFQAEVARPVEEAAGRILERIAGSRPGRPRMNESFEPWELLHDAAENPVPLENASGGEKEQVYLATRLALAQVLSRGRRRLIVLDDVLTSTDSARLARIIHVLEEVAGDLQILIITCHPERYRGLDRAEFFNFERIVMNAGV